MIRDRGNSVPFLWGFLLSLFRLNINRHFLKIFTKMLCFYRNINIYSTYNNYTNQK